mmetsp:Transcript_15082/g.46758  ORF Transcript_15082/g.46758 Transcript_15082/m.46758 type:complete len:203 (-) Transcript_15082:954-1562(-)
MEMRRGSGCFGRETTEGMRIGSACPSGHSNLKLRTSIAAPSSISCIAKSLPMHARLPTANGMKAHGVTRERSSGSSIHRSGRNVSASGPHTWGCRCNGYMPMCNDVPFGTKVLLAGSTMSSVATRITATTGGITRMLSDVTALRYSRPRSASIDGATPPAGNASDSSSANFSCTSGCFATKYRNQINAVDVVSCPAKAKVHA